MDTYRAYNLNFAALKIGEHLFDFQLDKKFFSSFEGGSILSANLPVELRVVKTENSMQLHFSFDGEVEVLCDRCLDGLSLPLVFTETLYVRFGEHTHEQADDVLVLAQEETHLALQQYLYEYAELHLPMRKVHAENAEGESLCNPDMLERMEQPATRDDDEIDPRWAALKALKNKTKK